MADFSVFEEYSKKKNHRERKCKVKAAFEEYDARNDIDGKQALERALASDTITDDAIRKSMQVDGIESFENAAGPQSVTFHRSGRCICAPEVPA